MERTLELKKDLKKVLNDSGVRGALQFLNRLSTHRFTALYRFDGKALKNLHLFDRTNPEIETTPEVPVLASYCVFVKESGKNFCVDDSAQDDRVADHPKKLEIVANCGVPLLDQDGKMFGTICHFDTSARTTESEAVHLMEEMADLLQRQNLKD